MAAGSIFPIAFPLIAGAGSITTILSLKAEYQTINILIALILNMVVIYLVLRLTSLFEKILGAGGLADTEKSIRGNSSLDCNKALPYQHRDSASPCQVR